MEEDSYQIENLELDFNQITFNEEIDIYPEIEIEIETEMEVETNIDVSTYQSNYSGYEPDDDDDYDYDDDDYDYDYYMDDIYNIESSYIIY